ncbi:bifunctional preprotein translocase subunit SecD/SecF [Rubripirellula obstinata]|uniref:Multifunctional fusion protein n=1 Tax=Rubripirellula obstinata TaxID=406547 RepID=A0A5B1CH68_9BACT|nr:protein translocase subunit SecD [Rubripirellula obstinata]KAA1259561.1 bifunctional preprotein translocase subunit SecD/SecF [Rubripirellula obstinata]
MLNVLLANLPSFHLPQPFDFAPSIGLASQNLLAQATKAGAVADGISTDQYIAIAVVIALLIVPFMLGNFFAKMLKMPNYGTAIGFILFALSASGIMLAKSRPGLGVDLSGGTILVYEMDPEKTSKMDADNQSRITSEDLVEPLTRRINPSGTQEIVIRPYGESQIEIIVPAVEQQEVDRIKKLVEEAGILRFAILANGVDHQTLITTATEQAESKNRGERLAKRIREIGGERRVNGIWAEVDREIVPGEGKVGPLRVSVANALVRNPDTGQIIQLPAQLRGENSESLVAAWLDSQEMSSIEALMAVDPILDITGEDLAFAASTFDQNGAPSVAFNLTDAGSSRFFALTTNNAPVGSRTRQLGIVLDDKLLSAPSIQSPIRKEGRITGRFTREEVEDLVQILKAGQLPAALTPQPIAENQIDPTLGKDTITKGVWAITVSLILVLVFILVYYRFIGVIACIALMMNLAMILATMVFINQPLTLPGLAGLVLTVGMSVDANVLIFERIREELKKGAASRMAIRNGFGKATITIIDANLTTLITAIVLYAIGTDQIRGFAVTLILGILFSMFTAIYVSRTLFDIAERRGFLSLGMSDWVNSLRGSITGESGFDFVGKGRAMLGVSAILVIGGLVSLFARGSSIFDIDFAGGSSVQFRLSEGTETDRVREIVKSKMVNAEGEEMPYTVNGVTMEGAGENTIFKLDSSEEKVDLLKKAVAEAFAEDNSVDLITYNVKISPSGDPQSRVSPVTSDNGIMLVAAQADAETADTETDPSEAAVLPSAFSDAEVTSTAIVELSVDGDQTGGRMNSTTLKESLMSAGARTGVTLTERTIQVTPLGEGTEEWKEESSLTFSRWKVALPIAAVEADKVLEDFQNGLDSEPVWISSSAVGSRVAGDMISRALGALFASLMCIIGYIWFRFQRVIYGFAAVAALIHDVTITLGAIAVSYWLADYLGILLIDPFKISLTVVAALLTIIGYSLNDTIVVFDRIRETKGKAPTLTGDMVNFSINQTLSRTLLTSITTLIVVLLLYAFGGDGIHAFAFALVVGVMVGTYSSVFVASPILLYLVGRSAKKAKLA